METGFMLAFLPLMVPNEIKALQKDNGKHLLAFFVCALNPGTSILLSTCCLYFSHSEFIAIPITLQTHSPLGCLHWLLQILPGLAQCHLF